MQAAGKPPLWGSLLGCQRLGGHVCSGVLPVLVRVVYPTGWVDPNSSHLCSCSRGVSLLASVEIRVPPCRPESVRRPRRYEGALMTSPTFTPSLPVSGGTLSTDVQGRRITLSAVAGNRWRITEPIGALLVGHGDIVAIGGSYAITSASGTSSRGDAWPEVSGPVLRHRRLTHQTLSVSGAAIWGQPPAASFFLSENSHAPDLPFSRTRAAGFCRRGRAHGCCHAGRSGGVLDLVPVMVAPGPAGCSSHSSRPCPNGRSGPRGVLGGLVSSGTVPP